jgi:hypothetical protein
VTALGALTSVVAVMFACVVSTGGVLSTIDTVTVKDAVVELPFESVAVHSTVVGLPLGGKFEPELGAQVTGRGPSTLSVAVGLAQLTDFGALVVVVSDLLAGMLLITGGMLSM